MKGPEVNALVIGKLMCVTAFVETALFSTATGVNHDALNALLNELVQMYKGNEFVRESVQKVLAKLVSEKI